MRAIRTIRGVVVFFIIGMVMVAAPQAPEADISGYYTSDSMKEGDSFRITPSGESYQVLWRYPAGDWVGVAIREGDTLAIGWHRTD